MPAGMSAMQLTPGMAQQLAAAHAAQQQQAQQPTLIHAATGLPLGSAAHAMLQAQHQQAAAAQAQAQMLHQHQQAQMMQPTSLAALQHLQGLQSGAQAIPGMPGFSAAGLAGGHTAMPAGSLPVVMGPQGPMILQRIPRPPI